MADAKSPSTKLGYVPPGNDRLFATLCMVKDIFDSLGVPYIITGGTLLGAVREQNLLSHDTDWDLEILGDHLEVILKNADVFYAQGLRVQYPVYQAVEALERGKPGLPVCERRIAKVFDLDDVFQGDLFIQTLFTDGMLRRINIENAAYFNAKMTFPFWFFEHRTKLAIRSQLFSAPAEPRLMLERIYGPEWQVPFRRHETKKPGYNFAGARADADVETAILFALGNGWVPHYKNAKIWPRKVKYTNNSSSRRWIAKHEHLAELYDFDSGLSVGDVNARVMLQQRCIITNFKKQLKKEKRRRSHSFGAKLRAVFQKLYSFFSGATLCSRAV